MTRAKEEPTEVTPELIREFLDYDPATGILTWRTRDRKWFKSEAYYKSWNAKHAGKQAGCVLSQSGYRVIVLLWRTYFAHRLIWRLITGEWPANQIDHINHNKADNRFSNLRSVTNQENMRNQTMRVDNLSGVTGVYFVKNESRWHAFIKAGGRRRHLGSFIDKNDAIAARKAAEREYGYHENHGKIGEMAA